MIPATSFLRIWLFLYKSYKKVNLTASYLDLIRNSFTVEYLIIREIALLLASLLLPLIFNLFRYRIVAVVSFLAWPWRYIPALGALRIISIEYLDKEVGTLGSFSRVIVNCGTCTVICRDLRALLTIVSQTFQLALSCKVGFCDNLGARYTAVGALDKQAFLAKLDRLDSSIKLIWNKHRLICGRHVCPLGPDSYFILLS